MNLGGTPTHWEMQVGKARVGPPFLSASPPTNGLCILCGGIPRTTGAARTLDRYLVSWSELGSLFALGLHGDSVDPRSAAFWEWCSSH